MEEERKSCCCHHEAHCDEHKNQHSVEYGEQLKQQTCSCGCHHEEKNKVDVNKRNADKIEKKTCSCGHNAEREEKQVESCCCGEHSEEKCGLGVENKQDENLHKMESCCCGEHKHEHKGDTHEESCCCHSHKKEHTHEHKAELNCCGIERKSSASACSCGCGGEVKSTGNAKKDNIINIAKLVISLAFLVAGFFNWHEISHTAPWTIAFYYVNPAWITLIICGLPILVGAVKSLLKKKITASVLISTAMISAVIMEFVGFFHNISDGSGHSHSYVFVAAEVAFLMAIGGAIEDFTVKKSRAGIERLVGLIPKEAFVKMGNELVKTSLSNIQIGDIVVAKAGEMIAVDGEIIKGKASIDQSSVTGEYAPAELGEGDKVYGGTFNKSGAIEIRVEKLLKDMTIAKMATLVEEAEGKKAPISRVADKWASVIVPTAILLAILVGIISGLVFKVGTVEAIIRTITVLIVFCPCSLALATPTAVAAGLGNSAKNGVLIKSGASLEMINKCDIVCFDKTGTLTKGEIVVSDIKVDGILEQDLLRLAASLEMLSEHPLAMAVVNKAQGLDLSSVENLEILQGVGVRGVVQEKAVQVIAYGECVKLGLQNKNLSTFANEFLEQGKTVVSVVIDGAECGVITFSDTIRENAREVVEKLKKQGKKTIMLTGDNEKSAKFVANACGIDEVKFGLLPEEKLYAIEEMQKAGLKVCMVGDGINDAPSLKLADCSVAMGALGSDIAIETADMAILNSDMDKIAYTMNLSKRTLSTIKRNIAVAMTINFACIILSLFGILTPMTGAIMHNVTSILVVLSSALLLINKKKKEKGIDYKA